jgi:dolichol-phosphate mannosyltransferase
VVISELGKTVILIATYNERENAPQMARSLRDLNPDADILFVDDSSPDRTGDLLDELAKSDPRLFVMHRPGKMGVGGAHLDGVRWAYERGYHTLVAMDCDFTHSPSDIPAFVRAAADADLVVGSRYMKRGSLPGWNLVRRFLTNAGHLLTRTLLGMPFDATGSFRLYRLDRITPEIFDLVRSRDYAYFFESLFLLHVNGVRIVEVPIILPARTYGHSKMAARDAIRSAMRVVRLGLTRRTQPGRLRTGREVARDPALPSSTEWDSYWSEKESGGSFAYDLIAATYRSLVIRRNLTNAIRRTFASGSRLLHAGCGSGQVDRDLHADMQITAIDLSLAALDLYGRNNPQAAAVRQASIFDLPFPDGSFDGVYNLGVIEHFDEQQIIDMLLEFRRVLTEEGRVLMFWPHVRGTSVAVLKAVHWVLHRVAHSDVQLHPPEISLLRSKAHAARLLAEAGLVLDSYKFGLRDGFVQAVVVGRKK